MYLSRVMYTLTSESNCFGVLFAIEDVHILSRRPYGQKHHHSITCISKYAFNSMHCWNNRLNYCSIVFVYELTKGVVKRDEMKWNEMGTKSLLWYFRTKLSQHIICWNSRFENMSHIKNAYVFKCVVFFFWYYRSETVIGVGPWDEYSRSYFVRFGNGKAPRKP